MSGERNGGRRKEWQCLGDTVKTIVWEGRHYASLLCSVLSSDPHSSLGNVKIQRSPWGGRKEVQ